MQRSEPVLPKYYSSEPEISRVKINSYQTSTGDIPLTGYLLSSFTCWDIITGCLEAWTLGRRCLKRLIVSLVKLLYIKCPNILEIWAKENSRKCCHRSSLILPVLQGRTKSLLLRRFCNLQLWRFLESKPDNLSKCLAMTRGQTSLFNPPFCHLSHFLLHFSS